MPPVAFEKANSEAGTSMEGPARVSRHAVVQEPNRCEGRNRRLAKELQSGSAPLKPEQSHASAVRSKHLNKEPGASHFLGIFGPMKAGRSAGFLLGSASVPPLSADRGSGIVAVDTFEGHS